ncbi:MAG TPA: PAS domain S-box protein, partial [Candidatus Binatia bacterium]|nr:PAS domain S-box protein [Candidatus Binatia bacterium]
MAKPAVHSLAALEKNRTACWRSPDEPGEACATSDLDSESQNPEALLAKLSENDISGLYKNIHGVFVSCNRQFCVAVGRTDIIGKTDFDLYPTRLAKKYRADDALVAQSGQVFETIEKNCDARKPNGYKYVHILKRPVRNLRGEVIGVLCLFWECESRHRAISALEGVGIVLPSRLEGPAQRYRYLIDCAQDVIFAFDELAYPIEISSAAETLLGYSRDELLRTNLQHLLTEAEFAKIRKFLRREICSLKVRGSGRPKLRKQEYPLLTVFSKRGEALIFELNAQATKLASGFILVHGIARNVTERKINEQRLEEAQTRLMEHVQRNACAVIGRFIAHQGKTPLGTIRWELVMLRTLLGTNGS